jgi:hypothetical protein
MGLDNPTYRTLGGLAFDLYATMLAYLALTLAHMGYIDQAKSRMDKALSEARQLRHAHTLANVLGHANWLDWLIRSAVVHIDESAVLTSEHGFPFYQGWAQAFHGQSLLAPGQAREGLASLTQGLVGIASDRRYRM